MVYLEKFHLLERVVGVKVEKKSVEYWIEHDPVWLFCYLQDSAENYQVKEEIHKRYKRRQKGYRLKYSVYKELLRKVTKIRPDLIESLEKHRSIKEELARKKKQERQLRKALSDSEGEGKSLVGYKSLGRRTK